MNFNSNSVPNAPHTKIALILELFFYEVFGFIMECYNNNYEY